MKRIIVMLAICIAYVSESFAQELVNGSLKDIRNVKLINLVIDYSEADILGMSDDDYSYYNEDWNNGKEKIYQSFKYMLDRECENHNFYRKKDAQYSLVFHIIDMNIKKIRGSIEGYVTIEKGDEIIAKIDGFIDKCKALDPNPISVFSRSMTDMGDHVAEFFNDNEK